ncbi:MAG: stage V sporulation protein AC [Negativicutes bacterium]|nr:stage V sporulation protein AC [Negativicutes bacterium]
MPDGGQSGSSSKWTRQYQQKVDKIKPKPPLAKNLFWAFVVGGLICVVGQAIQDWFVAAGMTKKEAAGPTSAVMIFFGAFFTGLGVYDELGRKAGAGSIVPITGFANSIVAPAMEFKREGYVFGIGAKMFVIAGPVIVYGTVTAVIVGFIYWLLH